MAVVTGALVMAGVTFAVARPDAHRPDAPRPAARSSAIGDAEARALLAAKVQQAQRRDARAYCSDVQGTTMCEHQWQQAGGPSAVPATPPRVVRSKSFGEFRALRACGVRPDGEPYEADFVVRDVGGIPRVHLAVWWGDQRFVGAFVEGSEPKDTRERAPSLC